MTEPRLELLSPADVFRALPVRVIALATGADTRTVERWRAGAAPRARYAARVDELRAILAILGERLSDAERRAWLESRNPALDWRRPAELLGEGRFDDVRAAAEVSRAARGDHAAGSTRGEAAEDRVRRDPA